MKYNRNREHAQENETDGTSITTAYNTSLCYNMCKIIHVKVIINNIQKSRTTHSILKVNRCSSIVQGIKFGCRLLTLLFIFTIGLKSEKQIHCFRAKSDGLARRTGIFHIRVDGGQRPCHKRVSPK